MKKKISVLITVFLLVTVLSVPAVYAADENSPERADFFKSMFDSMRGWVNQSKDNGDITEKEAEEWNNHFNIMEKFHSENGFAGPCGGYGDQQYGRGMMGSYYNGGMMGGYNSIQF